MQSALCNATTLRDTTTTIASPAFLKTRLFTKLARKKPHALMLKSLSVYTIKSKCEPVEKD